MSNNLEPTSPISDIELAQYGKTGIYIHDYELKALEAIEKYGIKLKVGQIKSLDYKGLGDVDVGVIDNSVVYLKIVNKGLKEIPAETNNLTNLKVLAYFGNQFPEMENMERLTNIEQFYGEYNNFQEIKEIENWANIKKIVVRGNPIKFIPEECPDSLEEINLWETDIDPSDPMNKRAYKNLIGNEVKVYIEESKAEELSKEPESQALAIPEKGEVQVPEESDIEWDD